MVQISFLLDEKFPVKAAELLESRGHLVLTVEEHFTKATADSVLLAAAEARGLVLVTFDNDFRRAMNKPRYASAEAEHTRAGLVLFDCPAPIALLRLTDLIEDIEYHYERALGTERRLVVHISRVSMRVFR